MQVLVEPRGNAVFYGSFYGINPNPAPSRLPNQQRQYGIWKAFFATVYTRRQPLHRPRHVCRRWRVSIVFGRDGVSVSLHPMLRRAQS